MNQIPNIEEVVEQFMMTWFRPAYFEALTPTNRQEQVIYDEAKLKWETCKQQLTETLHHQLQKALTCGKDMGDGSICGCKLDCHLHDWRQREEIQKAREETKARTIFEEDLIEIAEMIANGNAFDKENGLIWQHVIDEAKRLCLLRDAVQASNHSELDQDKK